MSVYRLEDRIKAVKLFLKWNRDAAVVVKELGYPTKTALRRWVNEYETTGMLHDRYRARPPKYSEQQKQAAVDYYLKHGRSLRQTIQALGYPHRAMLKKWLDDAGEGRHRLCTGKAGQVRVEFTCEEKQAAVMDLCVRDGPAQEVASQNGVTRAALHKRKNGLAGEERSMSKARRRKSKLNEERDALLVTLESVKQELETLRKEVYRLRLERDVLEATAEILKKGQGADPKKLTNREKAVVIGALRERYPLNELLQSFSFSKSSYFYQRAVMSTRDKYFELRERVRTAFTLAEGRYGYRRIHAVLTRDGLAHRPHRVPTACRQGLPLAHD